MSNPFLDRHARSKLTSKGQQRSYKQEKNLASRLGGLQTPASGAKHKKGDVYVKDIVRIEAKTTQAKSFSVTRQMIETVENAGLAQGEVPAMIIEFLDARGKPECEIAVIPVKALQWLIDNAKTDT